MSSVTVGIIYKHDHEPAKIEAEKLEERLRKKDVRVFSEEMKTEKDLYGNCGRPSNISQNIDWLVVLGGDGTLLGAARKFGRYGAPILGVNLGGLGFLTVIPLDRLYPVIEMMLEGLLEVESRSMLETKVLRTGKEVFRFQTLNDLVINKRTLARIIDLDVEINGEFLTTFRADGLIISTPTGSTAYNLAAGGPILYPTIESLILTPICPFTLTNRPIIIPDSAIIQIKMGKESEKTVILTFDGQVGFDLYFGDKVIIQKSEEKIRLLRPPDHSYFSIIRNKLMWGGGTCKINGNHKTNV